MVDRDSSIWSAARAGFIHLNPFVGRCESWGKLSGKGRDLSPTPA